MMKVPNRERRLSSVVLIAVAAILVLLAAYQYVWSEQAMRATTARMGALLRTSMLGWHMEFFHQFSDICLALRVSPDPAAPEDPQNYPRRFQLWQQTAQYPKLVSHVYLWQFADSDQPQILQLDTKKGNFEPGRWNATLQPLQAVLKARSANFEPQRRPAANPKPCSARSKSSLSKFATRSPGDLFSGSMFEANISALVHAIPRKAPAGRDATTSFPAVSDWLVVEIDLMSYARGCTATDATLLWWHPRIGMQDVALLGSSGDNRVIYATEPQLAGRDSSRRRSHGRVGSRHHRDRARVAR